MHGDYLHISAKSYVLLCKLLVNIDLQQTVIVVNFLLHLSCITILISYIILNIVLSTKTRSIESIFKIISAQCFTVMVNAKSKKSPVPSVNSK